MQASGETRREIAKSYSVVIVREGGRSSIPETAVIEPTSDGVLDCMMGSPSCWMGRRRTLEYWIGPARPWVSWDRRRYGLTRAR